MAESEVHRSRFRALARPLALEGLAAWLDETRAAHPGARHVVHAWRGHWGQARSSDDGEPAGTGGRPLLAALAAADVCQAAVAVVRWYGGTPLGAANLGRAYARTAAAAIASAERCLWVPGYRLELRVPGQRTAAAEHLLRAAGARVSGREWNTDGVVISAWIPAAQAAGLELQTGAAGLELHLWPELTWQASSAAQAPAFRRRQ